MSISTTATRAKVRRPLTAAQVERLRAAIGRYDRTRPAYEAAGARIEELRGDAAERYAATVDRLSDRFWRAEARLIGLIRGAGLEAVRHGGRTYAIDHDAEYGPPEIFVVAGAATATAAVVAPGPVGGGPSLRYEQTHREPITGLRVAVEVAVFTEDDWAARPEAADGNWGVSRSNGLVIAVHLFVP